MGENIELFPGVLEWFDRINEYGKSHGAIIEHYVISSGIKDIINKLHTENICRIRVGISKNNIALADYVLGRFGKEDDEKVNNILPTIESVIDDFTKMTIDELMQKYNRN